MENKKNTGHTEGVTRGASHSDSPARKPAVKATPSFTLHDCIVLYIDGGLRPCEIAVSHVTLRTGCDSRGGEGVTRSKRPLTDAVAHMKACFQREAPNVRHAFLLHAIEHYIGTTPQRPALNTFRQYASRMGFTVMTLDLFPLPPHEHLLLLPTGGWQCAPKVVWSSLAVRLLLRDYPQSLTGTAPPPR